MSSRNGRRFSPVSSIPVKLAVWLVIGMAVAGTFSGCNSTSVSENWPYQGPPKAGTNAIPVPHW